MRDFPPARVAAVGAAGSFAVPTGTTVPPCERTATGALGRPEGEEPTLADVHVYVDRPAGKEGTGLEDLKEALEGLDHVSGVEVDSPGNVVTVSFEGGRAEREAIERAVEEAGYGVSRLSVRSDPDEGPKGLWDI